MRVVGYLRVSTAKQQDGYGLASQREDILKWAETDRHTITAWRTDVISGTLELDDRDGWQEVAALIQEGKAEAVVVGRLDRLARDFMVQELLLRNLSDFGGTVFSTRPSENEMVNGDKQDPARELVRGVLGLVSEYDRKMTVMKLRSARAIKARAGGYAHGALPYGMRSRKGVLVPVPKEQKVIERMRHLSNEGHSAREIAAQLTAEDVPTKRGGSWTHATVLRVLSRENEKVAS